MRPLCFPVIGLIALIPGTPALAGLTLSISDASIAPGGEVTVDVLISSDSSDVLDLFSIAVQLSPGAGGRRLQIVAPPSPPGLDDTDGQLADPDYVLAGDSVSQSALPAGSGGVFTTDFLDDTYIGGDGTESMSGVVLSPTPVLLTRLRITSDTAASPLVGDVFAIGLIVAESVFYRPDFTEIAIESVSGGMISVVPEPSSISMSALGITLCILAWARSRRRCRPNDPPRAGESNPGRPS